MSSDPAGAHRLYSCDDHLDLYACPTDLWTSRLPSRFHEASPHVVERRTGRFWLAGDQMIGISGPMPRHLTAISRIDVEDDGFRASNPRLRLQDMDRDQIHASIVYGPTALFRLPIEDPELKKLAVRAWNDWAAEEFNSFAPDRLSALPALPVTSAEDAVAELERVLGMGHRGALFPVFEADLTDPQWDRLWAAAEEADVPISFHLAGGTSFRPDPKSWTLAAFSAIAPIQLDEAFAVMVYGGALERHPGLKIVLAESGVGWVPYMVHRMDAVFEKHCVPNPDFSIKTLPSELFRRQVWATFEEEPLGPQLIPLLGPDNFMWACDYPHPDSTFPESRKAIEHALGSLPPEAIRKITGENCQRLYRFP